MSDPDLQWARECSWFEAYRQKVSEQLAKFEKKLQKRREQDALLQQEEDEEGSDTTSGQ